jgi:hypothetical protein
LAAHTPTPASYTTTAFTGGVEEGAAPDLGGPTEQTGVAATTERAECLLAEEPLQEVALGRDFGRLENIEHLCVGAPVRCACGVPEPPPLGSELALLLGPGDDPTDSTEQATDQTSGQAADATTTTTTTSSGTTTTTSSGTTTTAEGCCTEKSRKSHDSSYTLVCRPMRGQKNSTLE